jgi:hypothetical protein
MSCKHDFQLETVGGVYLTGAYVCKRCSHRVSMSHEQFHRHAEYPRHYQVANEVSQDETDLERTSATSPVEGPRSRRAG